MPFMYILRCADRWFYVGSTRDLERRLWQHNEGQGAEDTKPRLPVRLEYFEEHERLLEAFGREERVQGWGHKNRQAVIDGQSDDLSKLSRTAKPLTESEREESEQ